MAISIQDDNNVTVKTKIRTVRDLVVGRCITRTATNVVPTGATPDIDCSLGDDWTFTPAETNTATCSNMQPGQVINILFLSSGTGSIVTTFGTGFHSTGTLNMGATSARYFEIVFKANSAGTALFEVCRTTAMA